MLSRYAIMVLINDCQFIITRNKGGKSMQILAAVYDDMQDWRGDRFLTMRLYFDESGGNRGIS